MKEISEIEDNMTDNLGTAIVAIEQLHESVIATEAKVVQGLQELTASGSLRLVPAAKWQETLEDSAKTKATNRQLNEVCKQVVKEKNALTKDLKAAKDKCAELSKELSDLKQRESRER